MRKPVPFDTTYFSDLKKRGVEKSMRETFTHIYETNHWSGAASKSGEGSDSIQTRGICERLPEVVAELRVQTFLDIPCGDFNWMNALDLKVERYIGADIVEELIEHHQKHYAKPGKEFRVLDLTADDLPPADMAFCRDCLVHLSYEDIFKAIRNLQRSGVRYLAATTFPEHDRNENIVTGDWRILNMEIEPFHFPKALAVINEGCTEGEGTYADKSLGVWLVEEIFSV